MEQFKTFVDEIVEKIKAKSKEEDEQGEDVIKCTHLNENPVEESELSNGKAGVGIAATAGSAAIAGAAVPTAATAGLTAVGFTGSGIAGGSIAAGIQAGIGNVVAGSTFATLQSVGATGGFAILGPLGLIAATVPLVIGGAIITTKLVKRELKKKEMEDARQMRIANGTARVGIDICEKCWKKMRRIQANKTIALLWENYRNRKIQ